jgi:hypothetical protein
MKLLCALIFACLSLQARTDPPAITAWSVEYNEHSLPAEYVAATTYVEDTIAVAALPAIADPVGYNEHSSFLEYVVATNYIEDDATYVASVTPPPRQPFQGYWLDDPVATVAVIDEYNVGPIAPVRRAAAPVKSKPARTVRGMPVENDHTAAIAAAMKRADNGDAAAVPSVFTPSENGFVIDRGFGFRVPDEIVQYMQAKDWW